MNSPEDAASDANNVPEQWMVQVLGIYIIVAILWLANNVVQVASGEAIEKFFGMSGPSSSQTGQGVDGSLTSRTGGSKDNSEPAAGQAVKPTDRGGSGGAPAERKPAAGGGSDKGGNTLRLVALCGALGAMLHALGSFAAFVGNRSFKRSWIWWYILQPIKGGLLAWGLLWLIKGGLGGTTLGAPTNPNGSNPDVGLMGAAFLLGLFSDRAMERFREIFDLIFKSKDPRRDPLEPKASFQLTSVDPAVGRPNHVALTGKGFPASAVVFVDKELVTPVSTTPTEIVIELPAATQKLGATLQIAVASASDTQTRSATVPYTVR